MIEKLETAKSIASLFSTLPVACQVRRHENLTEDGKGILMQYTVELKMTDAKHGNVVTKTLRDEQYPIDAQKICDEMAEEIKKRAKAVRSAIRTERNMGR